MSKDRSRDGMYRRCKHPEKQIGVKVVANGLTSTILFSFEVRNIYSLVHARSLGLCPTPTARTVLPSRLANSTMSAHWCSLVGSKTASGEQV